MIQLKAKFKKENIFPLKMTGPYLLKRRPPFPPPEKMMQKGTAFYIRNEEGFQGSVHRKFPITDEISYGLLGHGLI